MPQTRQLFMVPPDVDFGVAHTAGSTIEKNRISDQCVTVNNSLMEYAAYLRIVPFAAQNHALSILPMLLWSVKAMLESGAK
jgi:hypothetical protein